MDTPDASNDTLTETLASEMLTPEPLTSKPTLPPEWRRPEFVNATPADGGLLRDRGLRNESDLTAIGLMRRAAPFVEAFQGRLPLDRELKDIFEHFGVEIAQAVFSQSVEQSPTHGAFVRRVRSFDLQHEIPNPKSFEVTILRSAMPSVEWGAHVDEWRSWARDLGFTTDVIETREDADIRENARAISRYLMSHPHPRRILVTYGQGAAEFRSLLTSRFGLRANSDVPRDLGELGSIQSWINVNGAFGGAAGARLENDSWFTKFKLEISRYFGTLALAMRANRWRSLDSRLPAFRAVPQMPSKMQVINVVGLPLKQDIPRKLLVSYAVITPEVGPNDGVVSVFEALAPGLILPVPRMSHAAEGLRLEPVLKRVLAVIANDAFKDDDRRPVGEDLLQLET